MSFKAELRKQIAADQRAAARSEIRRLRDRVRAISLRRRAAMAQAVERCRRIRQRVRDRVAAYRAEERARINEEVQRMRAAAKRQCDARKDRIRAAASSEADKRRKLLVEERRLQRQIAAADRKARSAEVRLRKTRARESDDEVRHNLPDDLIPVFNKVRRAIKPRDDMSRTEVFLQWAEENPGEVVAIQMDEAEREAARLMTEHQLADVPF